MHRLRSWAALVFMTLAGVSLHAADDPPPFGMRLRPLPARNSDIVAPVFVRPGTENEAQALRRADGTLQIWYVARPSGREIHSITSHDNGRTWSEPKRELELPGAAYHALEMLLDDTGELQAVFHIYRGTGRRPGIDRNLDLWHCRTSGKGQTWGKPQRIYEGYVGSLRGLTQLRSGRLVLPFAIAIPERLKAPPAGEADLGWHDVVVFTSDDRGQSWQQSPARLQVTLTGPSTTRYGAVEPHVCQLKDGRVWMLIRDRCGRLYESYSPDGRDWSPPRQTRFILSDSPSTTVRLEDGRLVLFWCSCQRWDNPRSYALGGREALHAAISADEGRTWRGFREVLHEPAGPTPRGDRGTAYPSAVPTRDGKLLLVSGQGEGRRAIILLDADWLAQTEAADDFHNGLEQWTIHGAGGVRVVDRKLQIRQVDAQSPATAVWNFPIGSSGRLSLRVRPHAGFKSGRLALTDHFSIAGDTKADEHAVFNLPLDETLLQPDQASEIVITWTRERAEVHIAGGKKLDVEAQRAAVNGINYLRLSAGDPAGFQVESVQVKVND